MYKSNDLLDTTIGILTVMCAFPIQLNNNPKYNKLGGKTLYWLQDLDNVDVFFWDNELENILTEQEKISQSIEEIETDFFN
jgi:hypothetical protein